MGIGIFIIRFTTLEACLKANQEGFHFFDQKPLITKMWEPDMEIDKTNIAVVPI